MQSLFNCLPSFLKIGWATDIHLDYADEVHRQNFIHQLMSLPLDLLLLTGDIAESKRYKEELLWIYSQIGIPCCFILGNHDFYGSSLQETKKEAAEFALSQQAIYYLTTQSGLILNEKWVLIGHDGWCDGQAGDYLNSTIELRDYQEIQDFCLLDKKSRLNLLHQLGKESASQVASKLKRAFRQYDKVILLTHAPPFIEACLYENQIANREWAPHFVNDSLGKVLLKSMKHYTKKSLLVLCGHTHHAATYHPLPNLTVLVGQARYHYPAMQAPLFLYY